VGRLGSEALAGVAIAGTMIMLLFMVIMGVGTGASAMIARAYGQNAYDQANHISGNALLIGMILSVPVAIFGSIYSSDLFAIMGAEPDVIKSGTAYLSPMFSYCTVIFLVFVLNAVLQGTGDSVTPMKVMLASLILNTILDPILIFGWGIVPSLGVKGAAWGTIISRLFATIVLLLGLYRGQLRLKLNLSDLLPDWKIILRILKLGLPNSAQLSLRGIMGIVLMSLVTAFGTKAVAAFGVGHRLFMFALFPGFGFGIAAASLVGQNLGAGNADRSRSSANLTALYYIIFLTLLIVAFLVFPESLIRFFDSDDVVVEIGAKMLMITAICLPFLSLSLVYGRSLAGAGDTISPMIITLISLWGIQVPLAIILSRIAWFGVSGIFWANTIAVIVSGVICFGWFQRGKWIKIEM